MLMYETSVPAAAEATDRSAWSWAIVLLVPSAMTALAFLLGRRHGRRRGGDQGRERRGNQYYIYDHEKQEFVHVELGEIRRQILFLLEPLFQRRGDAVAPPPGDRTMRLVRLIYSAKSVERIFEPIYTDFWYEYVDASERVQRLRRFFAVARYYLALARAASLFSVVRLAKSATEYWQTIR